MIVIPLCYGMWAYWFIRYQWVVHSDMHYFEAWQEIILLPVCLLPAALIGWPLLKKLVRLSLPTRILLAMAVASAAIRIPERFLWQFCELSTWDSDSVETLMGTTSGWRFNLHIWIQGFGNLGSDIIKITCPIIYPAYCLIHWGIKNGGRKTDRAKRKKARIGGLFSARVALTSCCRRRSGHCRHRSGRGAAGVLRADGLR